MMGWEWIGGGTENESESEGDQGRHDPRGYVWPGWHEPKGYVCSRVARPLVAWLSQPMPLVQAH